MSSKKAEAEVQPKDYTLTFISPHGSLVLEDLEKGFWIDESLYQPGIPPSDMAYREGQRSVILLIKAMMADGLLDLEPEESYNPEEVSNA